MKSKGTKQALRALSNSYGILPTVLQIRESASPGTAALTGSFESYEEQTNAVILPFSASLDFPWHSLSGSLIPQTVEIRFATTNLSQSVLMHAGTSWGVTIEPVTGSWARVALRNSASIVAQTSPLQIFSGDYYSTTITFASGGCSLWTKRAVEETLVSDEHVTESGTTVAGVWTAGDTFHIGAANSTFGRRFSGYVDEFRVWTEVLTEDVLNQHVRYPGLYNGNSTTASRDKLLMRLSFNKPKNLGSATTSDRFYSNESPYIRTGVVPQALVSASAQNFANSTAYPYNMDIINRTVVRYSPNAGGTQFTSNKVIIADEPQLVYLSGSAIPILSHDRSIVTPRTKLARGIPSNTVGFYFSLTDAINDSIIRSIGIIDLQNLIGDPADVYRSSYSTLTALNKLYWDYYAYSYNPNSFVDFVRNLLDPLFRQAKDLVPARAKLLSGIVHEPHILERAKIGHTPMQILGGTLTRNQSEANNLFDCIAMSQSIHMTGAPGMFDARYTLSSSVGITGASSNFDARVTPSSSLEMSGDVLNTSGTLHLSMGLRSEMATFDDTSNRTAYQSDLLRRFGVTSLAELSTSQMALYSDILSRFRSGNAVNIWTILQNSSDAMSTLPADLFLIVPILPYTDFDKIESYTYFTDPSGFVGLDAFVRVRSNQNILTDRGTWARGTTYTRNDFVLQSGSNGDAAFGNSNEFVCVTTDSSLVSYIDPYLDTKNWRAMTYVPTKIVDKRQAVLIGTTVTLAVTGSGYTPVIGYRPQHYKFTRDNRLGTKRHQWIGCVQTDDTTIDGKPAVEITVAAGEKLFVHNPNDPIQPTNNSSGPILDVQ
jgi:hypothetical protein